MDSKISALEELAEAPNDADWFPVVDVSDTSETASGKTKKVSKANLVSGLGGGGGAPSPYDIIIDINGTGDYTDLSTGLTAATTGQYIYVKTGEYVLSTLHDITQSGLTIVGEDWKNTLITLSTAGTPALTIDYGASDLTFQNIGFKLNGGYISVDSGTARLTYDHCYFVTTASANATAMNGSPDMSITKNCLINTTLKSAAFDFGYRNLITNCRFLAKGVESGSYVISLSQQAVFSDNLVYIANGGSNSSSSSYFIQASESSTIENCNFTHESTSSPIRIIRQTGRGCSIRNNTFYSFTADGNGYIQLMYDSAVVSGNRFMNFAANYNGSVILGYYGGTEGFTINDNIFYSTASDFRDIYLEGSKNVVIRHNSFRTNNCFYGVVVGSGSTGAIIDCNIFWSSTKAVQDTGGLATITNSRYMA